MKYIGFDIGGTKCAVSLGEVEGEEITILAREEVETQSTPESTFLRLAPYIRRFKKEGATQAGISCGGPLDSEKGVILTPPNLPDWHGFEIVKYIEEHFKLTAKLENDANACAIAEWKFGAGRGTKNMVFLTCGTGLGAGLILDGKLYRGTNGNAGEVGHIRVSKYGPVGFGKYGSFEGYCSGGGIGRLAVMMARRAKKTPACMEGRLGYYGYDNETISAKELSQLAFAGDPFAKKVFARSGEMLGQGLSVLIDILNPERIILGGVYMRSAELLIPTMEKELKREALDCNREVCEILPAKLSENIGDYAALSVAIL